MLRSPCKVTGIETESAIFDVTATHAHRVDALGTKLGVGGLTTEFELSLLAIVGALSTGRRALVPGRT